MTTDETMPAIRQRLTEIAQTHDIPVANVGRPEDAFFLLRNQGALGIFWAAAVRGSTFDDFGNADFQWGGMERLS